MIRTFLVVVAILHALYAAIWLTLNGHSQMVFERWSVLATATVMTLAYLGFSLAYVKANKTRLNTAIALNKFYLFLFFGLLTLPLLWGIALRAPYNLPPSPSAYYALFVVPGWLRCYLYWGVSITAIGAVYEFIVRNWGSFRKPKPKPLPPAEPPDFLLSTDVVVSQQ